MSGPMPKFMRLNYRPHVLSTVRELIVSRGMFTVPEIVSAIEAAFGESDMIKDVDDAVWELRYRGEVDLVGIDPSTCEVKWKAFFFPPEYGA